MLGLTEPFFAIGLGPWPVPDLDLTAQPSLEVVMEMELVESRTLDGHTKELIYRRGRLSEVKAQMYAQTRYVSSDSSGGGDLRSTDPPATVFFDKVDEHVGVISFLVGARVKEVNCCGVVVHLHIQLARHREPAVPSENRCRVRILDRRIVTDESGRFGVTTTGEVVPPVERRGDSGDRIFIGGA